MIDYLSVFMIHQLSLSLLKTNPSLLQCNIRPLQIRWPLLDGSRARKVIENDYLVFQHFSILPSNSSLCSGRNLVLGQQDPSLLSSLFKEMSNSKTLLLIIALFRGRGISGIIKNAAFLQSCQRSYTLEGAETLQSKSAFAENTSLSSLRNSILLHVSMTLAESQRGYQSQLQIRRTVFIQPTLPLSPPHRPPLRCFSLIVQTYFCEFDRRISWITKVRSFSQ